MPSCYHRDDARCSATSLLWCDRLFLQRTGPHLTRLIGVKKPGFQKRILSAHIFCRPPDMDRYCGSCEQGNKGNGVDKNILMVRGRTIHPPSETLYQGNRNRNGQAVMIAAQPGNSISAWAEKSRQAGASMQGQSSNNGITFWRGCYHQQNLDIGGFSTSERRHSF